MRRIQVRWLLIVPAFCAIFTPLYARTTPKLGPIPFIVWFQFASVLIGAVITAIAYLAEGRHTDVPAPEPEVATE